MVFERGVRAWCSSVVFERCLRALSSSVVFERGVRAQSTTIFNHVSHFKYTHVVVRSTQTRSHLLIREKETKTRIRNSRFVLEHRYNTNNLNITMKIIIGVAKLISIILVRKQRLHFRVYLNMFNRAHGFRN